MPTTTVFLDTETTALQEHRRAWEISMIRRHPGTEDTTTITIFVDLDDLDLATANPASLDVGGFHQRHPAFGAALGPGEYHLKEKDAAALIDDWTTGAEIFGIRPTFDTTTLANALHRHRRTPRWWREPIDITDLARGWVLAHGEVPHRNPEALSRQCEVPIPTPHLRHTAYGDAEWVCRWYDALHRGVRTPVTDNAATRTAHHRQPQCRAPQAAWN